MKVYFDSKAKAAFTAEQWDDLHLATTMWLDMFNLRWGEGVVMIDMACKTIPRTLLGRCTYGFGTNRKHDGPIRVDVKPTRHFDSALSTLFHELTHVKQVLLGQIENEIGATIWEGKPVAYREGLLGWWYYIWYPWEVEARRTEKVLMQAFKLYKQNRKSHGTDSNHHGKDPLQARHQR